MKNFLKELSRYFIATLSIAIIFIALFGVGASALPAQTTNNVPQQPGQENTLSLNSGFSQNQFIIIGGKAYKYSGVSSNTSISLTGAQTEVSFNEENTIELIFLNQNTSTWASAVEYNNIASVLQATKTEDQIKITITDKTSSVKIRTSPDATYSLRSLAFSTNAQLDYANGEFTVGADKGAASLTAAQEKSEAQILYITSGTFSLSGDKTYSPKEGVSGRAFYLDGGTLTLTDITLDGFKSGSFGGAIYSSNPDSSLNLNCTIKNCESTGSGGAVEFSGTVNVTGGSYTNNGATQGGAFYIYTNSATTSTLNISGGATISDNIGTNGGAILVAHSNLTINNATISNNTAANGGGGIYQEGGTSTLTSVTMENNITTSSYGHALHFVNGATATINSGTYATQNASYPSATVIAGEATVNLVGGTFKGSNYAFDSFTAAAENAAYVLKGNPTIEATSGNHFWLNSGTYLRIETSLTKTYTVVKSGLTSIDDGDAATSYIAYGTNSTQLTTAKSKLSVVSYQSYHQSSTSMKTNYIVCEYKAYTVTFNGNGGSNCTSITRKYKAQLGTLPASSRTGYTQNGWWTATSGGTQISSTTTMPSSNITYYAHWNVNTYTITYEANSGTLSGTADTDYTKNYTIEQAITLPSASYIKRTGYIFNNWKVKATAGGWTKDTTHSGTVAKGKYGNVTLTAQWTAVTYKVKFNGNGNTGGSMSNQTHTYDTSLALTANAFTRTGYTFGTWNTKADGTGTSYTDKQSVKNLASTQDAIVDLYAQWTANTYTIYYTDGANLLYNGQFNSTTTSDLAWDDSLNGYLIPYTDDSTKDKNNKTCNYWSSGYNGGVSNPTTGYHAHLKDISASDAAHGNVVEYINTDNRWKGLNYDLPAGTVTTGTYVLTFDVYRVSGSNYPDVGLYHCPAGSTKFAFTSGKSTYTIKSTGAWERVSYVFNITNINTDIYSRIYLYGYSASGTIYLDNIYFGKVSSTVTATYDQVVSKAAPSVTGYNFNGYNVTYAANGGIATAGLNTATAKWGTSSSPSTAISNSQTLLTGSTVYFKNLTATNGGAVVVSANYTAKRIKLTLNANGGSITSGDFSDGTDDTLGETSKEYYIEYGTRRIFKSSTGVVYILNPSVGRAGYTLKGFYTATSGGTQMIAASALGVLKSVSTATSAATYYAQWTANTYTIAYTLNGGTAGSSAPTSGTYDTALTISNPTKTGHTFTGWSITGMDTITHYYGTSASSNSTSTAKSLSSIKSTWFKNLRATSGTVTFAAGWSVNNYTVSYNANGGSGTMAATSVDYGTTYICPSCSFTRTGYTFNHWNEKADDSGSSWAGYIGKGWTYTYTKCITLYAIWDINTYTITYENNGGTVSTPGTVSYNITQKVTLPVIARTGYTFNGWKVKATAGNWGKDVIYTSGEVLDAGKYGSPTLTAQFTVNEYTVTYAPNGGTVSPTTQKIAYGSTYSSMPTPTRTGYNFLGWNGKNLLDLSTSVVTQVYTVLTNSHTLTFNAATGTNTISGFKVQTYNNTTYVTQLFAVSAVAEHKYTFTKTSAFNRLRLAVNGSKADSNYIVDVSHLTNNAKYTISFKIDAFNSTACTATVSQLMIEAGSTKTSFQPYYVTASTVMDTTSNHTLTAKWSIASFTLTFNANTPSGADAVTQTATSKTVTYNSTTNLTSNYTATLKGWTFNGYYTAASGGTQVFTAAGAIKASISGFTDANKKWIGTSNKTVYAQWTINVYRVTLNNQSATTAGTAEYYYMYKTTKTINNVKCYYFTTSACTTGLSGGYYITKPTKTGYTFGGYYTSTNGSGTQYVDSTGSCVNNLYNAKAEDITLYAQWTINTYTVKFDPNGGYRVSDNNTSVATYTYNYGASDGISERRRTGYTLTGYTVTNLDDGSTNIGGATVTFNSSTKTGSLVVGEANLLIKMNWQVNSYKVTYNLGSPTAAVSDLKSYAANEYTDSNYIINWAYDFNINTHFKVASTGNRYLIFGSYSGDSKNELNVELTNTNLLRVYINKGAVDVKSSTAVAVNDLVYVSFSWDVSAKTWKLIAHGASTGNITMTGSSSLTSGVSSNKMYYGARDPRGTGTFSAIQTAPISISEVGVSAIVYPIVSKNYGTELGTLYTVVSPGYTGKGWYTAASGGSAISSSTMLLATDTTYFYQWSGETTYTITYQYRNAELYLGSTVYEGSKNKESGLITYTQTYTASTNLTIMNALKEHATITGWKVVTADGNNSWAGKEIWAAGTVLGVGTYGDVTLSLQYDWHEYRVIFNGNGRDSYVNNVYSGLTNPSSSKYVYLKYNSTLDSAYYKDGTDAFSLMPDNITGFDGWYKSADKKGSKLKLTTQFTESAGFEVDATNKTITIYAGFMNITIVYFDAAAGNSHVETEYGKTITLRTPYATGYTFYGWYSGEYGTGTKFGAGGASYTVLATETPLYMYGYGAQATVVNYQILGHSANEKIYLTVNGTSYNGSGSFVWNSSTIVTAHENDSYAGDYGNEVSESGFIVSLGSKSYMQPGTGYDTEYTIPESWFISNPGETLYLTSYSYYDDGYGNEEYTYGDEETTYNPGYVGTAFQMVVGFSIYVSPIHCEDAYITVDGTTMRGEGTFTYKANSSGSTVVKVYGQNIHKYHTETVLTPIYYTYGLKITVGNDVYYLENISSSDTTKSYTIPTSFFMNNATSNLKIESYREIQGSDIMGGITSEMSYGDILAKYKVEYTIFRKNTSDGVGDIDLRVDGHFIKSLPLNYNGGEASVSGVFATDGVVSIEVSMWARDRQGFMLTGLSFYGVRVYNKTVDELILTWNETNNEATISKDIINLITSSCSIEINPLVWTTIDGNHSYLSTDFNDDVKIPLNACVKTIKEDEKIVSFGDTIWLDDKFRKLQEQNPTEVDFEGISFSA